ncbi:transcriptional regulator, MarR family protein [Oceanicola sp. 22II-s10i]|uniref:MarR family winged helix-turn-helix transcriptional regulator n=1 Tax=Oceanicola sp. 22II-s10i TaxID=1317116 RepID=UPI000B528269|nr:MarR family transcriptional regulator [Oceanicola sp. 22II-s10i]OWU86047.1 transcriptional regulator, MarR family protein [Oceanicola sp. 22II-s10i]
MTFSRQTSAGYLVNDLARRFAAALQTRIKPMGLSTGVFPVMVQLWERTELTQAELVRRIGVEQATMANTLSRMHRDGLIERRQSPDDGRVQVIHLTEKGKALRDPAIEAALSVNRSALSGLTPEERDQFLGLLAKVVETFGQHDDGPPPTDP